MTAPDDYPCDMGMHRELDDTAAEAILAGRPVPDGDLAPVAALVREARLLAHETPPAPSPALASILAGDPVGATVFSVAPPGRRTAAAGRHGLVERSRGLLPDPLARLLRNVAAAGLAAKIALGTGVAAASMTGAAAAGVLPGPVQDAVAAAVRAVTPFEFHGRGHGPEPGGPAGAGAESDRGGLVDAPRAPAAGGTAPDDTPAIPGDPAPPTPEAPDGSVGGDPPGTPVGSSPPATGPGATPTTTAPPPGAGDPAAPPAVQPDPPPSTPEPAPTTPAPDPAEAPTADAPTPVDAENPEIPYEPPTTAPVAPEPGRP